MPVRGQVAVPQGERASPVEGIGRPQTGEHRLAQRLSPRPVRKNRRIIPNGPAVARPAHQPFARRGGTAGDSRTTPDSDTARQARNIGLSRLCGVDWASGGWGTSQYSEYLSLGHDWPKEWKTNPDVIQVSTES